jgi:dienelactone hydrolase
MNALRLIRGCCFAGLLLGLLVATSSLTLAQSTHHYVRSPLQKQLLPHDVEIYQIRRYLLGRIAPPPDPKSAAAWSMESKRFREQALKRLFHGWPSEWINTPPRFEETAVVETRSGYRLRKFRYEVLPGYYATAALYEPTNLSGKVPAVLNVLGHDMTVGKSADYMQKICINFAKQQVFALSLEWIGTGELNKAGNEHWFNAHLDLVGLNGTGVFYLAMRKGLDFLATHPNVDPNRIGVTGLSGGGWQTALLSGLDERVAVSVPVAGFSSLQQRVEEDENRASIGDLEQVPPDLYDGFDYSHLLALRAPKPTLLIYNAEDDCCFRAALVKPLLYDQIQPIFKIYNRGDSLAWYVNTDPGTHNYQRDNRQQAYRFFSKHLRVPLQSNEIFSDAEVRTLDELAAGVPSDNLTLLSLAQKIGAEIRRDPIPAAGSARDQWATAKRSKLESVLRFRPAGLARAWQLGSTQESGISTLSYWFEMQNSLVVPGVWLKATDVPDGAPATLVLDDRGHGFAETEVAARIDRGEQVLAANLLFTDENSPKSDKPSGSAQSLFSYIEVLDAVGDRAVGMEAARVVELAKWLQGRSGNRKIRVETRGIRSQAAALLAAALKPDLFSEVATRQGMNSFSYLLSKPVAFQDAADLFCLDLYKEFDINELEAMAQGVQIVREEPLPADPKTP